MNIDDLICTARTKQIGKKDAVCYPNEGENSIFIVKSGRLRVFLSYEGREFTMTFLEPGDVFATHTRAFVEAVQDSEILLIDAAAFRRKMETCPELSMAMLEILGDALSASFSAIESLVFHDVRQRLAHVLLAAMREHGHTIDDGIAVTLGLSTEEIGLLIGTSRQTTSQLINDLIRKGMIDRGEGRSFVIRDLDALESASQL